MKNKLYLSRDMPFMLDALYTEVDFSSIILPSILLSNGTYKVWNFVVRKTARRAIMSLVHPILINGNIPLSVSLSSDTFITSFLGG